MVSGHDGDAEVARALAGGKPYPTGWFRLYFEDERWEWSPEVEQLHGYEPGTAKPTTSMVLSHKHPEDYEQVVPHWTTSVERISRSAPATASSTSRGASMRSSWSPNCCAMMAAK